MNERDSDNLSTTICVVTCFLLLSYTFTQIASCEKVHFQEQTKQHMIDNGLKPEQIGFQ